MIAITIAKPGGPEVLQPIEMTVPVPGPREVLIDVAAAGVNRPDLMQREGKYPHRRDRPTSLASRSRARLWRAALE